MARVEQLPLKFIGLRAAAFALLEAEPSMSLGRMRDILACRNTIAQAFYTEWRRLHAGRARKGVLLTLPQAQVIADRASAFAVLDAKPGMTQTELRKMLGCRNDTARSIMAAWRIQRRNTGGNEEGNDAREAQEA